MKIKLCELNNNNTPDSNKGYYLLGAYRGTVILNSTCVLLWAELCPPKFIS